MHPNVDSTAIYNSQDIKEIWVSTNTKMDTEYVEYYSAIKENEILPFAAM